jgi:hypothetical protein
MTTPFRTSRVLQRAAKQRLAHVDGVRPILTASGYEHFLRPCDACLSRPENTIRAERDR